MFTACLFASVVLPTRAQDIEPRAYSNAPIGVNFLIAGYAYTRGGLSFDSAIPITDADLNTSNAVVAYATVLDMWGKSGKFDAIVPYTWLSGTADYQGEKHVNELDTAGDAVATGELLARQSFDGVFFDSRIAKPARLELLSAIRAAASRPLAVLIGAAAIKTREA